MSEEEIRLDQTKKIFDVLAKLISENESCTYRYLICDLLGFKKENYEELLGGLAITNVLVEREIMNSIIKEVREYIENKLYYDIKTCKKELLEILDKENKELESYEPQNEYEQDEQDYLWGKIDEE